MSWLVRILASWRAALLTPSAASEDVDSMSLHQWADLPAHHPVCD
jgi:hypothetical protein